MSGFNRHDTGSVFRHKPPRVNSNALFYIFSRLLPAVLFPHRQKKIEKSGLTTKK
jgi:hypothetical protein